MKLKGTVAFTLMVWALAAIVANIASAAVSSMFPLILVSSLRLSAVFVERRPSARLRHKLFDMRSRTSYSGLAC